MTNMHISLEASFDTTLKRELDARAIGSAMHLQMSQMMTKMDEVLDKVSGQNASLSSPVDNDADEFLIPKVARVV